MSDQPQRDLPSITFNAVAVGRRYVDFKLTQLITAVKAIAPDAIMGDWEGPFTGVPSDALGIQALSLNGVKMTVFNVDRGLPPNVFDTGRITNHLMPDAPQRLSENSAHAMIMPIIEHKALAGAIATARATTLMARAVTSLMQPDAVHWIDAHNVVPIAAFNSFTQRIHDPRSIPVELWVRFMCGSVTDPATRAKGLVAGTYGLWAFGLAEFDFLPSALPFETLLGNAYSLAHYLLTSGATFDVGDTLGAPGHQQFKVLSKERSRVSGFDAVQLAVV